jgi:hypothetical protein
MIRVHSGMRLEFKPENITSDSGRGMPDGMMRLVKPRSESNRIS